MTSRDQWQWQLLRAGNFRLDGGGMFGVVPKTIWSRMTACDEQNRIPLQTNCLLLTDGATKVVIETGFGGKWSEKERGFYDLEHRTIIDALRQAGVEPHEIDHVILTHLHFDHAGGLTHLDDSGEPVTSFPNATVHVQRTEWEDALANRAVMTRTYLPNHLDPVKHQVDPADGEGEVLPGITVHPVPGHTWGQHAVRFSDDEGLLCFPGDVMPTRHHVGPAFNMGYDVMAYENMLTKQKLLRQACDEGWRLVLDHDPGDPVVRVTESSDRRGRFELE